MKRIIESFKISVFLIIFGNAIPIISFFIFNWQRLDVFLFYAAELTMIEILLAVKMGLVVFHSQDMGAGGKIGALITHILMHGMVRLLMRFHRLHMVASIRPGEVVKPMVLGNILQ